MLEWDRSHDWVVQRNFHELTRVSIRFRQGTPSVAELIAVRRCLAQFRNWPPGALREAIRASGMLALGDLPTREARPLIESATAEGLEVVAENCSFVSYLPHDRTTGCAWLIEDDAESREVAEAMIALGVPVQPVEA
jgi:hypothetical protein